MASKIGKGEWIILYAVAGSIDVAQWAADIFIGPGEAANEIADPIIGAVFAGYFQLRGVSMVKHWNRGLSLIGGVLAEMLSVSVLPAWIFDVWYIHHDVRKEEAMQERIDKYQMQSRKERYLYQDGARLPPKIDANKQDQPAYIEDETGAVVRPPAGD